jgi:hypothetical protein
MTTGGLFIMDFSNNTVEKVSEPTHKVWTKETLTLDFLENGYRSLSDIQKLIESDQIRVKEISIEDIESFGFTRDSGDFDFIKDQYQIEVYPGFVLHITEDYGAHLLHHGKVKNKSELRRILTQLNIL